MNEYVHVQIIYNLQVARKQVLEKSDRPFLKTTGGLVREIIFTIM